VYLITPPSFYLMAAQAKWSKLPVRAKSSHSQRTSEPKITSPAASV